MDKLYHVFISSTYSDLKDERKRVSEAVAKAGYVPEGMELFPASSQKQLDFIKRVIDRCDYYVLIIGGRYGSLADGNISYTEMEYNYAVKRGVSILSFLHSEPDKIEAGKVDKVGRYARSLRTFREKVCSGTMVDFWRNPDELSAKVVVALSQEVTLNPGVGWVRGNQAIDPAIYQELEATRKERDELRARTGDDQFIFPSWLDAPDKKFSVSLRVVITRETRSLNNFEVLYKDAIYSKELTVDVSWNDIVISCGDEFFSPIYGNQFVPLISRRLCQKFMPDMPTKLKSDGLMIQINEEISSSLIFSEVRDYLVSSDLMIQENIRTDRTNKTLYSFSQKGRKYIAYLRASSKFAVP